MQASRPRLGQMLVEANLLTEEQLAHLLARQKEDHRRLGALVVEAGLVDEATLTQVLSRQLNAPWVSLYHVDFYRQLLNLIPHEVAELHCLIPVYVREVRRQGATLYVAMEDPTSDDARRACEQAAGLPVRAMIAPPTDIRKAIRVYYGAREGGPPPPPPRRAMRSASTLAVAPPSTATPSSSSSSLAASSSASSPIADEPTPASISAARPVAPAAAPPSSASASASPSAALSSSTSSAASASASSAAAVAPSPQRSQAASMPPSEHEPAIAPSKLPPPATPPRGLPRMMRLTLLDGTEIAIPAPHKPRPGSRPDEGEVAGGVWTRDTQLTAHDLVGALRAVAQGASSSEVLDPSATWEALFAALLSVLLRKHLIADWEFVEELKKV